MQSPTKIFVLLLLATALLGLASTSEAQIRVGADWSTVRFPGSTSESGLELRGEFLPIGAGLLVTYASYDLNDESDALTQVRFREFTANAIYGYGFVFVRPYSGLGISFSKFTVEDAEFGDLSSSDKALNLIQGVHFPFGRIVPFVEFRQALYLDDDELFGFDRRRAISAGLLVSLL